MAFLKLSETELNLDKVKLVYPGFPKSKKSSCVVLFEGTSEPYAFFGEDAEKIIKAVGDHRVKMPEEQATLAG
jgi:hypothetical protein